MDSDRFDKMNLSAKSNRGFRITRLRPWVEQIDLLKPAQWLTMYDLPSEDPEESGLPDELHDLQPQLLSATLRLANVSKDRILSALTSTFTTICNIRSGINVQTGLWRSACPDSTLAMTCGSAMWFGMSKSIPEGGHCGGRVSRLGASVQERRLGTNTISRG
jgi:hypothetical protein